MSRADTLRCFISVELPPDLRSSLYRATSALRESCSRARWVPPENLHITLKFLGNVKARAIPGLVALLKEHLAPFAALEVELQGAGAFPSPQRPRVVWLGVREPRALQALQQAVEAAAQQAGFSPEERPFVPHLTLGRLKEPRACPSLSQSLSTLKEAPFGKIRVDRVCLMQSRLSPQGAQYSVVAQIQLKGGRNEQGQV
jgi:2'-5' RNA ligase